MPSAYDSGDSAFLIISAAMVLLMTPGLAFFYGGMVKTAHVLMMLKMIFACLCLVTVVWLAIGYTLAFGPDVGGLGLIGNLDHFFLNDIGVRTLHGDVPTVVFSAFQMAFAIITVALISGSIAGRATMRGWLVFIVAWTLLVYVPMAHWVFDTDGWVRDKLGALDFAGGLPVELNAGLAGLATAIVLRRRAEFGRAPLRPQNLPHVFIGLALLWFGWFGFDAGSALRDTGVAPMAFLNTQLAAAGGILGWALVDKLRHGRVKALGVASAAVAGMVAITPACGEVSPVGALVTGLIAGIGCAFAVNIKYRIGVDDTLDVVGIHGVGGFIGLVMIGLFATAQVSGKEGLFYGGGGHLLWRQLVAIVACGTYSFVLTWLIAKAIDATIGFRARSEYRDTPGDEAERVYHDATLDEIRDHLTDAEAGGARTVDPRLVAEVVDILERRRRDPLPPVH